MSRIKTKAYGEIDVPEENAIHFKREIFGFDNYKDFFLIEMKDLENFYWLQSKEEADLAFVVVNPRLFKDDYELDIDDVDMELLELESEEDMIDLVIVNIPDDPSNMTINLLGPILINAKKQIAIQAISSRNDYGTKYKVFNKEEQEVAK